MPVDPQVAADLRHILEHTAAVGTVHDELVLLRIALRRYVETGDAVNAVAWAANEMSAVISRTTTPRP